MLLTEAKQIPYNACNINQAHKNLQGHPINLTDSDHDFILDEIKCRESIEYERDISVNDEEDLFT